MLEGRLRERDYLLGEYSIADMACFPWAFIARRLGVDLSAYPAVQAWRGVIKTRPAVQRTIELHKDEQPADADRRTNHQSTTRRHAARLDYELT